MKKVKIYAVLTLVVFAAASPICNGQDFGRKGELMFAGISGVNDKSESALPSFKKSPFEIGPEIFYNDYREFIDGDTAIKERGVFYGILFNYYNHQNTTDGWMSGFEGELAYGKLDYDGELQNGTSYSVSDIKDWLTDLRIIWGKDSTEDDKLNTLYFGLGYRYLSDDSRSDPLGYLRKSNYFYLPIGFKSEGYKTGWSLGWNIEFDLLLYGLQKSDLSHVDGPELENRQNLGSGLGFRAAVSLINRGDKTDFKIQPFVRYWHVGESESDDDYPAVEPENQTVQGGLQLIWTF